MAAAKGTRRSLLKKGLWGGALLSLGGGVAVSLRSSDLGPEPRTALLLFSRAEYATFAALADCLLDTGTPSGWPSPRDVDCAGKADALLATTHDEIGGDFKKLLRLFENGLSGLLTNFNPTPFTRLSHAARRIRIESWRRSRLALLRTGYHALTRLVHATYYGGPAVYAKVGYPGPPEVPAFPDNGGSR